MKLAELLGWLFPEGHETRVSEEGILRGTARYAQDKTAAIVGVVDQKSLGIEGALALAGDLLDVMRQSPGRPIVTLIDAQSQRMRRRDEMLGLYEYLAHLTKAFVLAELNGHRTVGILFGKAAAGAFIATGLAQGLLVAMAGAEPEVLDLPSIARVTKLPQEKLKALARNTPIFAPGLECSLPIGMVTEVWSPELAATKLVATLETAIEGIDRRDEVGLARAGRLKASLIARQVQEEAAAT